ncbi:hypothetical protein MKX79_04145 [Viridibacillus sp. FSL R5-0468]|uniref:hypothetical protein n=1 Tax=Viridibacillus sp. FSL R5-0468 TaxID=2921640 RepID=UPI0030FB2B91
MFKEKRKAKKRLETLRNIRYLMSTNNIISALYRELVYISSRRKNEFKFLSKREQNEFENLINEIESLIDYHTGSTINRSQISKLLMGDLVENTTNNEVIVHVKSILPQIKNICCQNNRFPTYIPDTSSLFNIDFASDLSKAMVYVSNNQYYQALATVDGFLLSSINKNDILEKFEIYIIYTFFNGLLLTVENSLEHKL